MIQTATLFDFNEQTNADSWESENDVVMGGRSEGGLKIGPDGNGVFSGSVSLENNGGFSMIQHRLTPKSVSQYSAVVLKVKGDGKRYQFRLRSEISQRHAYIQYFETTGDWQEITLPFEDFYATFRGRELDLPNYPGEQLEYIAILIGNGKPQDFTLLIDHIGLR
ncbi:CIA30 family protein [Robertkochia aurantiaca]|uniref:CIA30 family protein n=1 Tax=Robertkochia aurantiaca TaxID=2873700 RepID=UPI001CD0174C|nr:CIA30 family protein [Robertkochia sp. 3YJGBD-33]